MGAEEAPAAPYLGKLKGLLRAEPRPEAPAEERCELCGALIPPEHRHLVNLETRSLLCACRPCGLLFIHKGAAGGKYCVVPERCLWIRDPIFSDGQWESLQIPVSIAFFFHHSGLGRATAFYPGPAGAAESQLPMATWDEMVAANPLLSTLEPDVEALLVRKLPVGGPSPSPESLRVGEPSSRDPTASLHFTPPARGSAPLFDCYVVPIDACYELVGRIRKHWKGFQGGEEAWREIDAFFAEVRARSGAPEPAPGAPWPI